MDVSFHKFQNWANATLNFNSTSYSKDICAGHFERCYEHFITYFFLEWEFLPYLAIPDFVLASFAGWDCCKKFYVLHVISKLLESFLGPLGRPLLSIVPYALYLMRSDSLLFEAKNSIHSIYKNSKLLYTFLVLVHSIPFWLAFLAKIEYLVHFNLPKRPINQSKEEQQSTQQVLRAMVARVFYTQTLLYVVSL